MLTQDFHSMKYAELQKLAKCVGIRANQKVDKLIRALTEHCAACSDVEQTPAEKVELGEKLTDEICDETKDSSVLSLTPSIGSGTPNDRQSKKRRRTFELEEPTLKGDSTPVVESEDNEPRVTRLRTSRNTTPQEVLPSQPVKRLRRDTFVTTSPVPQDKPKGSPSTRAILNSIRSDCSSAERKEQLLSAIGKKVQQKMASSPHSLKSQPSQIPRFMAFLTNKKKESEKAVTPGNKNWNKVHEKEFKKFDSIDVYLEKKNQRKENLSASAKKSLLSKKSPAGKPLSNRISKPMSKIPETSKLFKPTVTSTKNINLDFSKMASDSKKTPKVSKTASKGADNSNIFKPTVLSTKNMSCDFSKVASHSSKTPKSRAFCTPTRKNVPTSSKVASTKAAATPFKFTGNTTSLNSSVMSSKKTEFDLKASLARPLSWKPHTGKLQPIDFNTHLITNTSVTRSANTSLAKSTKVTITAKARKIIPRDSATQSRPLQAKNVRRAAHLDRRNNQKYIDMMRRRGLIA